MFLVPLKKVNIIFEEKGFRLCSRKPSTDASYYSALTKQLTREDFKVSNLFSLLSEELNWVIKEEYIKRER